MSIVFPGQSAEHCCAQIARLSADLARIRRGEAPSAMELERAPILNRWAFGIVAAPCLVGAVTGHPRLGDRPCISTSELYAFDVVSGWARSWSRFYRLGIPYGGFPGGGHA